MSSKNLRLKDKIDCGTPSQLDIDHLQNDGVHTYKDNDHAASNEREPPFK